jgi:protein-S-isoprenylcysteine O-methyltransferase
MHNFLSLFITFCFVGMAIFWVITAFSTKKTIKKSGGWIIRIIFYLIVILVILLQRNVGFFSISLWSKNISIEIIADVITAFGLIVMIWARVTLGKNWSANIVLKEDHKLITTGPYAYVRHPIYTGLILMVLGVVLHIGSIILISFFVLFFFGAYYKASKEEKLLITNFPGVYLEYKRKVKALIPFIF